jgi:hypothetical protein
LIGAVQENSTHEPVALTRVKPVGGSGAVQKLTSAERLEPITFSANTANRYCVDGFNPVTVKVGLKLVPIGIHSGSQFVPDQLLHF